MGRICGPGHRLRGGYTRVDGRIKPEKLLASFVRLSHLLNLGTDFGYKSKVDTQLDGIEISFMEIAQEK